jgi:hypothetical protein
MHQNPLFDSTEIAFQASATMPLEYERALAAGVGIEKKMISTSRGVPPAGFLDIGTLIDRACAVRSSVS